MAAITSSVDGTTSSRRATTDDDDRAGAGLRTTASQLTLDGLIKHVAVTEQTWLNFVLDGPSAMPDWEAVDDWADNFRLVPGETFAGVLDRYAEVARRTDEIVAALPSLDVAHPLPPAPWFEPGVTWSARRVLLHVIAETSQHAGHADLLRESLDGAKSMG